MKAQPHSLTLDVCFSPLPLSEQSVHSDITLLGSMCRKNFARFLVASIQRIDYLCLDVLKEPHKLANFDYIVMNGVFTEKQNLSFDQMFTYFKDLLSVIFQKPIVAAFNVMSSHVDWEREDSLSPCPLTN